MDHLIDDLRVALRRFRHQPSFTAVVVLTLAFGLGANTAIFTLVDALLLRSLPVDRPEELYRLGDTNNCCVNSLGLQGSYSLYSYRLVEHLRAHGDDFVQLTAFQANAFPAGVRVSGRGGADALTAQFVSGTYFRTFAVQGPWPAACSLPKMIRRARHRPSC